MPDKEKVFKGLEKAKNVIEEWVPMFEQYNTPSVIDVAIALLKEQPDIVRCKDCAYALFKEGVVEHGHIFCTKPFTERWQAVKPNNWFCADGERNEGR